jgi:hypothetical protein
MISLIASIDSGIDMFLTAPTGNVTAIIGCKWNRKHEKFIPLTETAVTYLVILTAVIAVETLRKPRNIYTEARTDEAYREWLYYRSGGMSHTVASRELVRQVPVQKQRSPPLYSLRDFVPQSPLKGRLML